MNLFKKLWPIFVMLIFIFIYFQPEFEGKKILGADSSQFKSLAAGKSHYSEKTGDSYLWNPGFFSGSSDVYGAKSKFNIYGQLSIIRQIFISRGAWTFFLCLFFSYLLGLRMKFSKLLSLGLAFAITLAMSNIILYKVGHFSKIETLVITPFILMGLYVLFEQKKFLLGGGILAFAIGFSLYTRHPQMSYYIFIMLLPYIIVKITQFILNKEYSTLIKSMLFGLLAVIIGVGGNTDRIWNMKVHGDASNRSGKILKNKNAIEGDKKSTKNGLDWEYAMAWSNTTPDVIATIIPGFAGGGASEKLDENSNLTKKYGMKAAPLYWGGLPFTESPMYLGIILFLLMILALATSKSIWLWGLFGAVFLSILISYGKNLEWVQRILFDYFPLYNKFRAPQSILNITVYFIPIIGFLFLNQLKNNKNKETYLKPLYIVTGSLIAFILLLMVFVPSFYELTSQGDQRYVKQGLQLKDLIDARKDLLTKDTLRAILYILLTTGVLYFYFKNKLKYNTMILVIIVLISVDWLTINARYYSFDQYKKVAAINNAYTPRTADKQILAIEPTRENYRVLDLSINTFNSGSGSYYHNTIGGYSPVKFQRYQDLIEGPISKFNRGVLGMLNTKYIITQDEKVQGFANNGVAWFTNKIIKVSSPEEEIAMLDSINTKTTSVVFDKEFSNYIDNFQPKNDASASVSIVNYTPDRIDYQTKTASEQFLVFSEMWMDGESWKAYIDGEKVPFVRANYMLRALRIPSGEHTITFEYKPQSQYLGGKIALVFGFLGLAFLFLGLRQEYLEKKQTV